jgi:C-terminal processing protease CtpA/Prc
MRPVGLFCLVLLWAAPAVAQPDVPVERLGGVGVVVAKREGRLVVIRALPGTAAAEAGLRTGDIVVAIDGVAAGPMTLETAVRRITGQPGTTVELVVVRPDGAGRSGPRRRVRLVRALLRIEPGP